jgi:hypothetical protein
MTLSEALTIVILAIRRSVAPEYVEFVAIDGGIKLRRVVHHEA